MPRDFIILHVHPDEPHDLMLFCPFAGSQTGRLFLWRRPGVPAVWLHLTGLHGAEGRLAAPGIDYFMHLAREAAEGRLTRDELRALACDYEVMPEEAWAAYAATCRAEMEDPFHYVPGMRWRPR